MATHMLNVRLTAEDKAVLKELKELVKAEVTSLNQSDVVRYALRQTLSQIKRQQLPAA